MSKLKSYCLVCNREQNQTVLHREDKTDDTDEIGWWEEVSFQIIQCGGCDEISFRKLYNNAALQAGTDEDTTVQELHPRRDAHSRPFKKDRRIPLKILMMYHQSVVAYNSQLFHLTAMGLRATLEGICIDKKIKKGRVKQKDGKEKMSSGLDGKISGLAEKGFIAPNNAETLHELRFLGNEVIHELKAPTAEELALAFDIIEISMDNIYIVNTKAEALKANRTKSKS